VSSRNPDPLTEIRPAELFMRFAWAPGRCLFCKRDRLVAAIVDVAWEGQQVAFEACQPCVFGIFSAYQRRWQGGDLPNEVHYRQAS